MSSYIMYSYIFVLLCALILLRLRFYSENELRSALKYFIPRVCVYMCERVFQSIYNAQYIRSNICVYQGGHCRIIVAHCHLCANLRARILSDYSGGSYVVFPHSLCMNSCFPLLFVLQLLLLLLHNNNVKSSRMK